MALFSSTLTFIGQRFPLRSVLRREFAGYNVATFQGDLLAGITVAAVALPLALAFGIASGATAAAGLVTAILAGFFFVTSMALAWLAGVDRKPSSILGTAPATQSQPGGATPIAPPTSGGVLDTLKKVDEQQAPSGPQAPRSQ